MYQQMIKKLASYKTLTGRKNAAKANPKIAALQVELLHVDSEIEKLVDSLTGANNVLLSYVNLKIAELDGRKQELLAWIAELTVEAISRNRSARFPATSTHGTMYPLTTSGGWWI